MLLWFVFFNSIGFNTNTEAIDKFGFAKSLPEGWGFFTKSPQDEMVDLYVNESGQWSKIDLRVNRPTYYFGTSREARMLGFEISILLSKIESDSLWLENTNIDSIDFPTEFINVNNQYLNLLKDGEYALVKRKIVPWAWRNIVTNKQVKYEILGIKCSERKS
jgi:antimicrobial peptide system SdpA family protein